MIALTLLPAIALLIGERLRPRARGAESGAADAAEPPRAASPACGSKPSPAVPMVTVTRRRRLLGLAAVPAPSLRLALPDNSTAPTS